MTFKDLHKDITCDCVADATQDFESTFGLKTNKDHLREVDFNSHWDKGQRPKSNECHEVCSYKGKSISLIVDSNVKHVLHIFQGLFTLSPGYKPYFTIVKFGPETGLVKATPDSVNPYHYDFYKSDNFQFNNVQHISSTPISENV